MTRADLARYRAVARTPTSITYRGHKIWGVQSGIRCCREQSEVNLRQIVEKAYVAFLAQLR